MDFRLKIKIGKLELPLWALIFGIGLAILLIAAALAVFFWRRRRKSSRLLNPNIIIIPNKEVDRNEDPRIEEFKDVGNSLGGKNSPGSDNTLPKPKKLRENSPERAMLEKFVKFNPLHNSMLKEISNKFGPEFLPENLRPSKTAVEPTNEIAIAPKTGPIAGPPTTSPFEFNSPERALGIIGSLANLMLIQFTTFRKTYIQVPYAELFMSLMQKILPPLIHESQEIRRINNLKVSAKNEMEKNIIDISQWKDLFLDEWTFNNADVLLMAQEVIAFLTVDEIRILHLAEEHDIDENQPIDFMEKKALYLYGDARDLVTKILGLYYLNLDYAKFPNTKILPDPINKGVFWIHEEFKNKDGIIRKRQIRLYIGEDGKPNHKVYFECDMNRMIEAFYKNVPRIRDDFQERMKNATKSQKASLLKLNPNFGADPEFEEDLKREEWGNKNFGEKYGGVDQSDIFTSKESFLIQALSRNPLFNSINAMFYVAYKFMQVGKEMGDKEFFEAMKGGLENFARAALTCDVPFYQCWDIFMTGESKKVAPKLPKGVIPGMSCNEIFARKALKLEKKTIKAIKQGDRLSISLNYEKSNLADPLAITQSNQNS